MLYLLIPTWILFVIFLKLFFVCCHVDLIKATLRCPPEIFYREISLQASHHRVAIVNDYMNSRL